MRILIAEDDAALAGFVRQGLAGEHYAVDVVEDGEQARAMGSEFDYDLVILDLNLPKLDGVSVLRHLRLKRPSLPVLVLTQRSRVEDRVQCLDTGADDYVPKRLSSTSLDILHIGEDLIAKIKAAAGSRWRSRDRLNLLRKPPHAAEPPMKQVSHGIPAVIARIRGAPTLLLRSRAAAHPRHDHVGKQKIKRCKQSPVCSRRIPVLRQSPFAQTLRLRPEE
ncbi:MAG: response regulator [Candidatus Sulfotelmatobacter sp.]